MIIADKKINIISKNIKKYKSNIKDSIFQKKYDDTDYLERILYYINNNIFYITQDNINDLIKASCYIANNGKLDNSKVLGVIMQNTEINKKKCFTYYFATNII